MKLKTTIFALVASALFATSAMATTVVYVHGTSPDMSKQDAYDYWNGGDHQSMSSAPSFVDISRNGKPYYITYRDGRQHVKPQAIELANQIYHNVSDSQIIVVTHSMGGLIFRYIMANPSNDGLTSYQRYQFNVVRDKVRRIVNIAAPHTGSPAANFTNTLRDNPVTKPLASWLGYDKDAMDHLTTNYWENMNQGMLSPDTIKRSNGSRPHVYMLGSRDASNGEPWYWRQWEHVGLEAIDAIVNFDDNQMNAQAGTFYDKHPEDGTCVDRAWWGGCNQHVDGDNELDNDGMVSAWSGNFGNYSSVYFHKYTSWDSHHTNRYADSVAQWAKNFVY